MGVSFVLKDQVRRIRSAGWAAQPAVVHRLAHGALWVLAGTVAWRLLTAVSTILVARILGRDAFGELSIVRSTVDLFVVFGSFRLGSTATKYVAEYRRADPARAGSVLLLITTASLITCSGTAASSLLLSPWLAEHVLNRAELAPVIALSALLILFATLAGIHEVALAGFEAFRSAAYVNALRGLAALALCVPFAFLWGIRGVITALIFDSALALCLCVRFLHRECRKHRIPLRRSWGNVLAEVPVLWKFALPGVFAGLMITGTLWVGRIILVRGADGYAQLGLFSAANQWRTPMLFLSTVLSTAILPILSEAYSRENTKDMSTAIGVNLKIVCVTALPATLLVMCFATPIQGLFGDEFRQSAAVLRILMPATFLYAVDRVFERVLDGAGRRWMGFAQTAGWSVVFMIFALLTVPKLGGLGLALALFVAYAVLMIGRIIYVDRVLVPGCLRQHTPLLLVCVMSVFIALVMCSYASPGLLP